MMNDKKRAIKKTVNIILTIVLVLGILSSSFGVCALAMSTGKNAENGEAEAVNNGNGDMGVQPIKYEEFSTGGSKNEMSLKDNVKIFTAAQTKKIYDALKKTEDTYNNRTKYYFEGSKDELFGDLERGDIFLMEEDASSEDLTVILKVESIYEDHYYEYDYTEDGDEIETEIYEVELVTSEPSVEEVFDSVDIGFEDVLQEENLVDGAALDGVELIFGDIESEFEEVAYESFGDDALTQEQKQTLDLYRSNTPDVKPLAQEHSVDLDDIIIKLNFKVGNAKDEEEDKDDDDKLLTGDVSSGFSVKGKIGLKDLAAYATLDMPQPGQFNEVMFGIRGKKTLDVYIDGKIDASFQPKETKWEHKGKLVSWKVTGLNEKMIPIGIWEFTGSSFITINSARMKDRSAKVIPSIFLMLYMDAEGNFTVEAKAGFKKSTAFNTALSVYKNGKLNFNVINYPYTTTSDGEVIEPDKEESSWYFEFSLEANATLTLLGASAQFWIAGINIGEIEIASIGFEAKGDFKVTADSVKGVSNSISDGSSNFYLRAFFRAIAFRSKVSAEAEAFHKKLSGGFDFEFRLLDATLFKLGYEPEKTHKTPVSTQPIPAEFATLVCLVTDISGSMGEGMGSSNMRKIDALKEAGHAITTHMESMSKQYEGAQGISIAKFDDIASTVAVPHNDYTFINECIDTLEPDGATNIAAGLDTGISQIENSVATQKIIILMSDGQDNCSSRAQILEQAARAKKLGIKIFTIGFGSSVDESILREVAETTGGEYKYSGADSIDSIVSITGSFLSSYEKSQGDVLVEQQGKVAEGETVTVGDFDVPDKSGDLCATCYWPGSILDIVLIDPNDREVDEDYPGATMNKSTIPSTVTITNPIPGEWTYKVRGVETSYDEEPFYAITSFKTLKRIDDDVNPKLDTFTAIGAYCLPIGVFTVVVSSMLLVSVNKKKKEEY